MSSSRVLLSAKAITIGAVVPLAANSSSNESRLPASGPLRSCCGCLPENRDQLVVAGRDPNGVSWPRRHHPRLSTRTTLLFAKPRRLTNDEPPELAFYCGVCAERESSAATEAARECLSLDRMPPARDIPDLRVAV